MNKLLEGSKVINIIDDCANINYELNDYSSLVLNIFNHDIKNQDIEITLTNNANLVINYAGLSYEDSNININAILKGNDNRVIINGRFISMENLCAINVDTYANKKTINNFIDENLKGINEDGKVIINPILRIDTNEVNASHSASVGKYDKNVLFYLQSKGLDKNTAKDLIKHSFLNCLYSDNFIQMLDQKRGENE